MKVIVVLALVVAVCAAATYKDKEDSAEKEEVRYTFEWSVNDEDSKLDFSHKEQRENDQTSGVYKVLLPDGVVQTVTYTVDGDNGYVANVENAEAESEEAVEVEEPKKRYN